LFTLRRWHCPWCSLYYLKYRIDGFVSLVFVACFFVCYPLVLGSSGFALSGGDDFVDYHASRPFQVSLSDILLSSPRLFFGFPGSGDISLARSTDPPFSVSYGLHRCVFLFPQKKTFMRRPFFLHCFTYSSISLLLPLVILRY